MAGVRGTGMHLAEARPHGGQNMHACGCGQPLSAPPCPAERTHPCFCLPEQNTPVWIFNGPWGPATNFTLTAENIDYVKAAQSGELRIIGGSDYSCGYRCITGCCNLGAAGACWSASFTFLKPARRRTDRMLICLPSTAAAAWFFSQSRLSGILPEEGVRVRVLGSAGRRGGRAGAARWASTHGRATPLMGAP